jgi:osmotically-inducible protein OsmY
MTDSIQIEADVRAALIEDPRVPSPEEIAIKVDGSAVTLRGTVGSFVQRRAAAADAGETAGVLDVYEELQVRLLDEWQREDAEIRGAALQMIMWDIELPSDSIDVKVADGWVTLKGQVDYQFQSDGAFDDVASLYGVVGVTNDIRIVELV